MQTKWIIALVALATLTAAPALADPYNGKGWRGGHRVERSYGTHRGGHTVVRRSYREHTRRYRPRRNVRRHRPLYRQHGYRRPYVSVRETVYISSYAAATPHCNSDVVGTLVGGVAGAAIGSGIGKGGGRTAAIFGGAILGAVVGNNIGRSVDQADYACNDYIGADSGVVATQAEAVPTMPSIPPVPVETTPIDDAPAAEAPDTPNLPNTATGRYCREYQSTATVNGQIQPVYGTACQQPDGSWEIVS